MPLLDELRARREEIYRIASQHGIDNIRVFGSVARGEERAESDIDFLIRIARDRSLLDLIGFKLDTEDLLSRTCDVVSEHGLHHLIGPAILAEAQPL